MGTKVESLPSPCSPTPFGNALLITPIIFLAVASVLRAQDATNAPPLDVPPALTSTNVPISSVPLHAPAQPQPSAPVTAQPPPASGPEEDIEDIRPPVFHIFTFFWVWIALIAGAVVALLLLLWYKFKPGPRQLSAKSAYELTLEKLNLARELLREDDPVPYAVFVSETVRSYLGQRFQNPSSRRTTEEFLRLMDADPNTPLAEHSELLRQFLQACDLVKFAKYQPTLEELEAVQQRAVSFVSATRPELTRAKGGTA